MFKKNITVLGMIKYLNTLVKRDRSRMDVLLQHGMLHVINSAYGTTKEGDGPIGYNVDTCKFYTTYNRQKDKLHRLDELLQKRTDNVERMSKSLNNMRKYGASVRRINNLEKTLLREVELLRKVESKYL